MKPGRTDLSFGRTRPRRAALSGQPALVVIPDEGGIWPDENLGYAGHGGGDGRTIMDVDHLEHPAAILVAAFRDDALPLREADPGPQGATDPHSAAKP